MSHIDLSLYTSKTLLLDEKNDRKINSNKKKIIIKDKNISIEGGVAFGG